MPSPFEEKYKKSKKGLLYIAPTGSGKTREAIKVTRGTPTTVIGTASLTKNFETEEQKAFDTKTKRNIDTYSGVARTHVLPGGQNVVLDESHNIRNPKTKAFLKILGQRSKYDKALLMTATPIVNEPYDIASQINLVANKPILPGNKATFYEALYKEKPSKLNLLARLRGVKQPYTRELRNPEKVKEVIDPYIYIKDPKSAENLLPKRDETVISVPMVKNQQKIYKYISGSLPFSMRYKIKKDLPPSKQESKALNAYLGGMRQIGNTTKTFRVNELPESPKLEKIVSDLKDELKRKGKVIVYSNYLESGINEIKKLLERENIPYSHIVGSMSKAERQLQMEQYNKNKNRVMLLSGAGSEGINLPDTSLVQLTEPHWNEARLHQVSSRGIRRDSKRKEVKVNTYLSTFPDRYFKLFGAKLFKLPKRRSADQYLYGLSKRKDEESKKFLKAIMTKKGELTMWEKSFQEEINKLAFMGRQEKGKAFGPGGVCKCPTCGTTVKHKLGTPCYKIKCPKCGATMGR